MINYKSLKDHVYDYISNQINTGSLKAGERLNENQICDSLQVSRTPVREALIQLFTDGYLDKLPRRGFIVREINQKKVSEIYTIIGCLEGMAANIAAKKLTDETKDYLHQLVDQMDEAIHQHKYSEYYKLQLIFHDTFITASENEELLKLITNLKKNFIKQSYENGKDNEDLYRTIQETNNEHKIMLEYFENGDSEKIEKYMREVHWSTKYAQLESLEV